MSKFSSERAGRRASTEAAWTLAAMMTVTGCAADSDRNATPTPTPTETPAQTITESIGSMVRPQPTVDSVMATATPAPSPAEVVFQTTPESRETNASKNDWLMEKNSSGKYIFLDVDGNPLVDANEEVIEVALPDNFIPDGNLRMIAGERLDFSESAPAHVLDFQRYLNSSENPTGKPLAGYTDGVNDYNQYKDHESGPQVPMYSWFVLSGEKISVPGIGELQGTEGNAVMVLIHNIADSVHRFPTNSVEVEAGFEGWGRIWDGSYDALQETAKRLTLHYLARLGSGVPETGFIGQCDEIDNCDSVTVVNVVRWQHGNNEDGSPRYQFRLLDVQTLPAVKVGTSSSK